MGGRNETQDREGRGEGVASFLGGVLTIIVGFWLMGWILSFGLAAPFVLIAHAWGWMFSSNAAVHWLGVGIISLAGLFFLPSMLKGFFYGYRRGSMTREEKDAETHAELVDFLERSKTDPDAEWYPNGKQATGPLDPRYWLNL